MPLDPKNRSSSTPANPFGPKPSMPSKEIAESPLADKRTVWVFERNLHIRAGDTLALNPEGVLKLNGQPVKWKKEDEKVFVPYQDRPVFEIVARLDEGRGAPWEDIVVQALKHYGITEGQVEDELNDMMAAGVLYEPILGRIRRT